MWTFISGCCIVNALNSVYRHGQGLKLLAMQTQSSRRIDVSATSRGARSPRIPEQHVDTLLLHMHHMHPLMVKTKLIDRSMGYVEVVNPGLTPQARWQSRLYSLI